MNVGKLKREEFIDHLGLLSQKAVEGTFYLDSEGKRRYERQYLTYLVKEARELINYNEWCIALENTIDNLCEINYKLKHNILNLAVEALNAGSNKSSHLDLIELLRE